MRFCIIEVFSPPESCYFNYINGIDSEHFVFIYNNKDKIDLIFFTEYCYKCLDVISKTLNLNTEEITYTDGTLNIISFSKPCIKVSYICKNKKEEIVVLLKRVLTDYFSYNKTV